MDAVGGWYGSDFVHDFHEDLCHVSFAAAGISDEGEIEINDKGIVHLPL